MPQLTVDKIKKDYEGFGLMVERLECGDGEFMTILGPSGSGKTTLLKIIAGLVKQDGGRILVGGSDISGVEPEKRRIGMVFQKARLFPNMTLEENVSFGIKMQGIPKSVRSVRSAEILDRMGLSGMGKKKPHQLSGGQKKRAAIARALLYRKDLLLMDEPFNELEPNLRREMRHFVKDMHREYGFTAILVTHDREEAFELSDRIAVMREGKIVEESEKNKLYRRPETVYTARFLGERNIFPCRDWQDLIRAARPGGHKEWGDREGWLLMPERAVSLIRPTGGMEGYLQLPGVVHEAETTRNGQEIVLATRAGNVHAFKSGFVDMRPGDGLTAFIDKKALHLLREG